MKLFKTLLFLLFISVQILQAKDAKKYLPRAIYAGGYKFEFTYDDRNRFTTIMQQTPDSTIQVDSIRYADDGMKFTITTIYYANKEDYLVNDSFLREEHTANYKKKSKSRVIFSMDSQIGDITFNSSGRVKQMTFNSEDSDDKNAAVIIGFKYDKRGNITGYHLPNNASGDRVNRSIQMVNNMDMQYDTKNGIFKNVNMESFLKIYDYTSPFPFFYFLNNNIEKMIDKTDGSSIMDYVYRYNEQGYPVFIWGGYYGLGAFRITYIEAK